MNRMEPTRHLKLEGAYNVRDLGGYPTVDGRTTRWRMFLRADSLHRLSPESQAALLDLGIRSVVDLRRKAEVEELPNVFASSSDVVYFNYSLAGDTLAIDPEEWQAESLDSLEPSDQIAWSYGRLLDRHQAEFGRTLATLADPATPPAIYHCAGGQGQDGTHLRPAPGHRWGVPRDNRRGLRPYGPLPLGPRRRRSLAR